MRFIFHLLASLVLTAPYSFAQTAQPFQGTVTYAITHEGQEGVVTAERAAKSFPNRLVYHFSKDGSTHMSLSSPKGGAPAMDVVAPAKGGKVYMYAPAKHKMMVMDNTGQTRKAVGKPVIKKTGRTMKLMGYECEEYTVLTKEGKKESRQEIWATTALQPIMPQYDAQNLFYDEVKGMPLRMVMHNGSLSMIFTATDISTTPVDAKLFRKPDGYVEEQYVAPRKK